MELKIILFLHKKKTGSLGFRLWILFHLESLFLLKLKGVEARDEALIKSPGSAFSQTKGEKERKEKGKEKVKTVSRW